MHVIWQANWYGGDSTVVVGEKRWFVTIQSHKRNRPEKDQVKQKKQSARFSQQ